jgi:Protein of unknown function (DUF2726)
MALPRRLSILLPALPPNATVDFNALLPWLLASLSAVLLFAAGVLTWMKQRKVQHRGLPTEWALTARPVFSADERRVYRQLREALPHHIVLSKLPMIRFCQPTDVQEVRYWYQLLGGIHVTFAICSANGRVLAAIDLENERTGGRRSVQIKQAVLNACRVRYVRCTVADLPSPAELQLMVPHAAGSARGPQAARAGGAANGRRTTLWQDSSFIQDSFFHTDPRDTPISDFGALRAAGELPTTSSDPMERILRPHPTVRH